MVCCRHKNKPARRRCYYCGRHICLKCQHHSSNHIFCGSSCSSKYLLKNAVKKTKTSLHENARGIFRNAKSFAGQTANIAAHIYRNISQNISLANSLPPALLTIITISSLHGYVLISADKPLHTAGLLMPSSEMEHEQDDTRDIALKNEKPLSKPEKKPLLDVARGDIEKKELSLTFDGGAEDSSAKEILEILRKKDIRTTIFLTGEFIKKYPELVKEMAEDGHEIGNHTFSHPHLTTYEKDFKHMTLQEIDKDFLSNELRKTAELFKETTGRDMSPLWRAPYGEINKEILQWAFDAGYIHISWTTDKNKRQSLDSLDWVKDEDSTLYLTADEIKEKIINFDKNGGGINGGIVLMHLGTERKTQEAHKKLEDIIDTLSSQGYRFVKVSQMLAKNQNR